MSNVNDILAAITQAHDAYNQVPELKRTIANLEYRVQNLDNTVEQKDLVIANNNDVIAKQSEEIRSLKEALDEARFQELLAKEDADKLRDLVRSINTLAAPVAAPVAEVKPEEPKVETESKSEPESLGIAYDAGDRKDIDPVPTTNVPAWLSPEPVKPKGQWEGYAWYDRPNYIGIKEFEAGGGQRYPYAAD